MKKILFCAIFLSSFGLLAQNDMHANIDLQFRFANPGARAQAMGGAFIGLADDTTAIFANPAGLARLASTTVVAELGNTDRDNNIPFYSGTIDRVALQDFEFNLQDRDFPETTTSVPFVAYVDTRSRLKWGVFYAEQANFERRFETAGVTIPRYRNPDYLSNNTLTFFPDSDHFIDLQMRTVGVSAGFALTERLSVGVTLNYNDFQYEGKTDLFIPDFQALFPNETFNPAFLDAIEPLIGDSLARVDVDGDDQAVSIYAGILFAPNPRFSIGLAYKQQPKFEYDFTTNGIDTNTLEELPTETGVGDFRMPDSYGAGISFKPTDLFIFSLEINRVLYSELAEDFTAFFANPVDPANNRQVVGDVTEYHAGIEYIITSTTFPLSLRAGYWLEPYHALQNEKLDTQILFGYTDESGDFLASFRQNVFLQQFAEDENHITFGAGLSVGRHFALDVAADIADETSSYSLSGIYRF